MINRFKFLILRVFLVEFQNGRFTSVDNLVSKRVTCKETNRHFVLVASPTTVYKSPIRENYAQTLTDTYIAIHDKKTNKVRLVQVEEASLQATVYDTLDEQRRPQRIDKNTALRDHSGKNGIRYLDRQNRMQPNVNVNSNILEKTKNLTSTDDFYQNVLDMKNDKAEEFLSSAFPVVDKNAKTVKERYSLTNMISEEIIEHLHVVAMDLLKSDLEQAAVFINTYLTNVVKSIQLSKEPDSKENLDTVAICVYADSLIRLINRRNLNLGRFELSKISDKVENDIKAKFCQQNNDEVQ